MVMQNWINWTVNWGDPIDISVEIGNPNRWMRAWYQEAPKISPVVMGDFVGSVESGAGVNFNNVFFNPHAHGTHTETYGHITKGFHPISALRIPIVLKTYLIQIKPAIKGDDLVILPEHFEKLRAFGPGSMEALVIQTDLEQNNINKDFSDSNPPYLDATCIELMDILGVQHLLIDLPSVDREQDEGKLAFHHAFWKVPSNPQKNKTITEMVSVPKNVQEGWYAMNLQVASFHNDAAPSRPVLYKMESI
ncbi:MAG: cyclase family protein [Bacteroidetes bacterium]|nr:cyclase family protein [Bacteroidota bacterium]